MHKADDNRKPARALRSNRSSRRFGIIGVGTVIGLSLTLAGCGVGTMSSNQAHINTKTKFSESSYGVNASKRVTTSKNVKKGGGTYKIGSAYMVKGRWYTPKDEPDYDKSGLASWYGPNFHGRYTANGEIYDQNHLSAAHPTLPLPCYVRVTNKDNGNSVIVRVNDRGPFEPGRIIDVSSKAADMLQIKSAGVANVRVQFVGPARMDGKDMPYLMASFQDGSSHSMIASAGSAITSGLSRLSPSELIGDTHTAYAEENPLTKLASAPAVKGSRVVPSQTYELPEYGPVPRPRPAVGLRTAAVSLEPNASVAAFAEERMNPAYRVFDTILTDNDGLTEDAIVASWERREQSWASR